MGVGRGRGLAEISPGPRDWSRQLSRESPTLLGSSESMQLSNPEMSPRTLMRLP